MCFALDSRPPLPPIRGGAVDGASVSLTARDGTTVSAYAARAENPSGAGVVIVPDVRGLHPYYEELALRFAETGVHAVAVDLYGRTAGTAARGNHFEHEPHVMQLRWESVSDDVATAARYLRSVDAGAPERVYTVGFCLGGRISFLAATMGLGVSGVIGLYGWPTGPHRTGLPAPADEAPRFSCPVLAIYGGADAGIPADARDAFDGELTAAGVEHRTIVYPDAPHSYFDRKAADHRDASLATWREMLDFMDVRRN